MLYTYEGIIVYINQFCNTGLRFPIEWRFLADILIIRAGSDKLLYRGVYLECWAEVRGGWYGRALKSNSYCFRHL
jgi:hypothetical protein